MPHNSKKRSTGPATPEGKEQSKKNAKTHELLSSYACLSIESQAECDLIERGYIEEYRPATPTISKLVKDLALFHWRGDRCVFFETALLYRSLVRTSEDATLEEPQDIMNDRAAEQKLPNELPAAPAALSRDSHLADPSANENPVLPNELPFTRSSREDSRAQRHDILNSEFSILSSAFPHIRN